MGELDGEVKQMATSRWLGGASWQEALGPARIRLAASSSRSGLGAHLDANFPESLVCRSLFTDGVLPGAEAQQVCCGRGSARSAGCALAIPVKISRSFFGTRVVRRGP
jgi:hypothetical protein